MREYSPQNHLHVWYQSQVLGSARPPSVSINHWKLTELTGSCHMVYYSEGCRLKRPREAHRAESGRVPNMETPSCLPPMESWTALLSQQGCVTTACSTGNQGSLPSLDAPTIGSMVDCLHEWFQSPVELIYVTQSPHPKSHC